MIQSALLKITLGLLLALPGNIDPGPPHSFNSGDPAWESYCQMKQQWVTTLHRLVVSTRPDLQPVADATWEWRKAEIDFDTRRFKYIFKNHPHLIVRDQGLPAFVNLDWFPEFSKTLRKQDPSFAELEQKVMRLKEASQSSDRWPDLKTYIDGLARRKEYKTEFKRFYSDMAKVQRILNTTYVPDQ